MSLTPPSLLLTDHLSNEDLDTPEVQKQHGGVYCAMLKFDSDVRTAMSAVLEANNDSATALVFYDEEKIDPRPMLLELFARGCAGYEVLVNSTEGAIRTALRIERRSASHVPGTLSEQFDRLKIK